MERLKGIGITRQVNRHRIAGFEEGADQQHQPVLGALGDQDLIRRQRHAIFSIAIRQHPAQPDLAAHLIA